MWGLMAAVALLMTLEGCAQLPSNDGREVSMALQATSDTRLGKAVQARLRDHPGKSGIAILSDGREAFGARMVLADAAERSLDIQYYIWNDDLSGSLLLGALRRAAARGVRVRLLLDDNNTRGLDDLLADLDGDPHIEVRLFNPFAMRKARAWQYLTDFARLDRRMHNKSFTVDNQVTVIGGRNIGDQYFDAGEPIAFVDLDLMAIGAVVTQVSDDFDRYWASPSSYPARRVLGPTAPKRAAELAAAALAMQHEPMARRYADAIARSPFVRQLMQHQLPFEWVDVQMLSDDPAKGLGLAQGDELLWPRLKRLLTEARRELRVVSPYFVPGSEGVESITELANKGVKITILTNSLETTDVPAVHAGYAKRRLDLLHAGVALFEMKRTMPVVAVARGSGSGPSSSASLHAKTFSVDGNQVFVGSFNFDPRSERLNTEMGFVIDSASLARMIEDSFKRQCQESAYEVRLASSGGLEWVERSGGVQQVHAQEPGNEFWTRFEVMLLSVLPIEWLL